MSDNPFLSEFFQAGGTPSEEDLQKTAAAELLVKIAEENEVSLDDLSDEEIAALVEELSDGEADAPADDAEEHLKEAEFTGRYMARAFYDELTGLQKEAAGEPETALDKLAQAHAIEMLKEAGIDPETGEAAPEGDEGLTVDDVAEFASEVYGIDPEQMNEDDFEYVADLMEKDAMLKEAGSKASLLARLGKGATKPFRSAKTTFGRTRRGFEQHYATKGRKSNLLRALARTGKKHPGVAAAAGTPVAAGGAGAALLAGKNKKASQLDLAIHERALEMLAEAGYIQE